MDPGVGSTKGSLYVGDLHQSITEADLFSKFSPLGTVLSIKVCRDIITRRSLGYAYINFENPNDAAQAIDLMNFEEMKGKRMRVSWCQRNPASRRNNHGNVFIKNLDKTIDDRELYDTFSEFGSIMSCKIAKDNFGNSKGYGFIHFDSEEVANTVIETVHGKLIKNKLVYLAKFLPRQVRAQNEVNQNPQAPEIYNLFIKNFGDALDDVKLKEMFGKFGVIKSSKVMVDAEGKSKGFGFVSFENQESAMKAIEELNGSEIAGGHVLYVGKAQSKDERHMEMVNKFNKPVKTFHDGVNLYVKDLDQSINHNKLIEMFSPFGNIVSARIMLNRKTGNPKGYGFVCFETLAEAGRAISEMNGRIIGSKPIFVGFATKDPRKAPQSMTNMPVQYMPAQNHQQYVIIPQMTQMEPRWQRKIRGMAPVMHNTIS